MLPEEQEDLFKTWLFEYERLILRVIRAYTITTADRDDLFQQILLQLWSSIPSFQGDSSETTWIYRIALNTALVWKRKEKKHKKNRSLLLEKTRASNIGRNNDLDANNHIIERLYSEIRTLPKIESSIVLMYLDGLSYRQMAEILDISENNVGVKLSRAKKLLAQKMKGLIDDF